VPVLSATTSHHSSPPELGVWGPEIRFQAPAFFPSNNDDDGSTDETFTFAVFGDMGTAEEDGSRDFGREEVRWMWMWIEARAPRVCVCVCFSVCVCVCGWLAGSTDRLLAG
jgi:hypothetical protein